VTEFWLAVRAIHVLAMAFFVGGQIFLAAVLVPIHRRGPDRGRMRAVARRFAWGTLGAVGVLLASGIALATRFGQWSQTVLQTKPQTVLQTKLSLVALVGPLIVWHMRRPELRTLDVAIFGVSLVIVWLGLSLAH
jgi:putative copper export protein